MVHLLVTNDFPPKVGGIQSYLWELWRRLPADDFVVFASAYEGSEDFDRAQPFRVVRSKDWWLLPKPSVIREVKELIREVGASFVVLDPPLPLGLIGPHLGVPYWLAAHGAETIIPANLPVSATAIARVMKHSCGLIGSSDYVPDIARRWSTMRNKTVVSIPPGVDVSRFKVFDDEEKRSIRMGLGLPVESPLIVSVSRLVKRKGFDRVIQAADQLADKYPGLTVAIAGTGRDEDRLQAIAAKSRARVVFLGRVSDADLPGVYGCGDVFAMACHDRWMGLEREGFGIVFVEAAAAGVPVVAGLSGGSHEAVADGQTGFVVPKPVGATQVAEAIDAVLRDPEKAASMARAGRNRVEEQFSYESLARSLQQVLASTPV